MPISELKTELRREAERRRSSLTPAERAAKSAAICDSALQAVLLPHLRPWLDSRDPSLLPPVLFTYIPFRSEVDVAPLLHWCWSQGVQVAAPRVDPKTRSMTLHLLDRLDQLEPGAYGILEPPASLPVLDDWSRLAWMLVPGLTFDWEMGRLGYGAGYYDRFIERCLERTGRVPYKLALAFDAQIVPQVPMETHDLRVDAVVTESRAVQKML